MRYKLLASAAALVLSSGIALADGYDLTHKSINELATDATAPASGDYTVRFDASANAFKRVDATSLAGQLGINATATEINRAADVSARNVTLTGAAETLTEAAHDGKIIYVDADSANQAITLPDGGTASGAVFTIMFASAGAPAGDYAVTIAVPAGDNSSFTGIIFMANEATATGDGGALLYASSATLGGTDTLTFNSANTEPGDFITIVSAQDTSFVIDGSVRFESVGEDSVLIFSSAVTSTD